MHRRFGELEVVTWRCPRVVKAVCRRDDKWQAISACGHHSLSARRDHLKNVFAINAEHLSDTPRLGKRSTRPVGRVAVENLRDLSYTGLEEIFTERAYQFHRTFPGF